MSIVLSSKLRDIGGGKLIHWCPGCKARHVVHTQGGHPSNQNWHFNGNVDKPSFFPSMHIRDKGRTKCHYFVEDGMIRFLVDSDHIHAGRTVALPDLPDHEA